MNIFRCRICGEPYIGLEMPTHCPFCGAHRKHLVPAAEYRPTAVGELTDSCRENLRRVLELAAESSAFYRGAARVADSEESKALFAALARHAAEHASIVCKILGVPKPEDLYAIGACAPSHRANLAEAHKRKERAVYLYCSFLEEATEERVRQVLEAFIEIESDHLQLSS